MPTVADDEIAQQLAAAGLRATRQRIAVMRALRRLKRHPTAIEIHRSVTRTNPNLSRKTVYEVLDVLVAAHLAACVTDGGEPYRYEANALPHYHARCRSCGQLFDIPASADSQIRGRSALPEGFAVEEIRVTIHGRCYRCREYV
jgi:Fe2+ or Zn2+ uptake regulation protein